MKKILFILLLSASASAQIMPSGHLPGGVIWASNQVGVVGGIPNVTTIYTNLYPGADDWGTINRALKVCPSNEVVYLNAGTYTLTNYLWYGTAWDAWLSTAGH
jgi:hypothetical protein